MLLGLITFALNWQLMDIFHHPIPGYKLLLYPGNLSLVYLWHPIFTEELNYWAKLILLLIGQFMIVAITSYLFLKIKSKIAAK